VEGFKNKHLLVIVFFRADSIMYSTANEIGRERARKDIEQSNSLQKCNYSNDGYSRHSAYSTSMTVVPIAHCIAGFNLNENDYVNATVNCNGSPT
jgi:hypothetical protein